MFKKQEIRAYRWKKAIIRINTIKKQLFYELTIEINN